MAFNYQLKKTKVMFFRNVNRKKAEDNNFNFCLDGEKLDIANSYKYLGHIISNQTKTHNLMMNI